MLHIFLYLVENTEDPFEGLKKSLQSNGIFPTDMVDVRLHSSEYRVVQKVEYSARKYIRILYYLRIYSGVKRKLLSIINAVAVDDCVFVYISDEGVWAELVNKVLAGSCRTVHTVNVQHGFALVEKEYHERWAAILIRKFVNWMSEMIVGYPMFGLGFGRGRCDVYLCYDEAERQFLLAEGNKVVYVVPRQIKSNLLLRYQRAVVRNGPQQNGNAVLIAMPACVPGTLFKCNLLQFIDIITPAVEYLVDALGRKVIIRFHPGRNTAECVHVLERTGLSGRVQIDGNSDIVDSLVECSAIIASHSTALFEADLLGKVPIAIQSDCFRRPLQYKYEMVDMAEDYRCQLEQALNDQVRRRYRATEKSDQLDWGASLGVTLKVLELPS